MLLLAIFCLSAGLVTLASQFGLLDERRVSEYRVAGVVFVGSVLLAILIGLVVDSGSWHEAPSQGLTLVLITAVLYALLLLRRIWRLSARVADLLVLLATVCAILAFSTGPISTVRRVVHDTYLNLGNFAVPLTMFWMWLIARMTAALNRTPQVTGGYLGIVALTLGVLVQFNAQVSSPFPSLASAALAGAGLATLPAALRRSNFNIGWAAALAMGFLLAQISVIGLEKRAAFVILALSLLAFGLPLLDVSFYQLSAVRRGKNVTWQEQRLRLHEALLRRGISPAKIAALYLSIGMWLCLLGVLAARFVLVGTLPMWRVVLGMIILAAMFCAGLILFFSLTRILMRRGAGEEVPDNVSAFGVQISPVSMQEAMDKIEGFIREKTPQHVVTSDANAILRAQEDPEYAQIMQRAALVTPDGFGVIWGARLLNLPIYERVTGVDMVTGICERAAQNNYSIYILGAAPGIASTAAQKLMERYPGLRVVGTQHGYFKPEEEASVVQRIREAKPDVLFVAFGIPKQEKFIAAHLHEMNVPVSLGVGGSFDVYSDKLKRAPQYIQRSGMEWLYRVWQEPWRWKRMSYVPRFMLFALREWIFGSSQPPGNANGAKSTKTTPSA